MLCSKCRTVARPTEHFCSRCGTELLVAAHAGVASAALTRDADQGATRKFNDWDSHASDAPQATAAPWQASSSWNTTPPKPPLFKRKGFYIPTAIVVGLIAISAVASSASKKTTGLNTSHGSEQAEAPVTTPATTSPAPTAPPVTAPPVTAAPVTAPPVTAPPVTTPPVTAPRVTAPRATVPPAAGKSLAGETTSQANARQKAADYLDMTAFSRKGLIDQLVYEGFTQADATYGVDALNANWNDQAAKKAADYLQMTSFSHQGLIDQLVYEGFTQAQAEYGVSTTGL